MIVLLNTSSPHAELVVVEDTRQTVYEWEAGRSLAHGLLGWIESSLRASNYALSNINGIGVFKGPGSFTGLRIGMTVVNSLAEGIGFAVVAETGDNWQQKSIERLRSGETDGIALPLYDREANITKPRK